MRGILGVVLVAAIGCFAACLAEPEQLPDSRDSGSSRVAQSQSCKDYLACLASVAPENVGAGVANYGSESTCWANSESAALCEKACTDARAKAGCGDLADSGTDGSVVPPKLDASPDSAPPKQGCEKMDIVFVVDDSGSMSAAQAKLRATFPAMSNALASFRPKSGVPLDFRFAVTSTDTVRDATMGGKGGFVNMARSGTVCNAGPTRTWIERSDADAANLFACRADLGTTGSATEKPIDGLVLSVTDRAIDQNFGFLRNDALFAFVILTDEDDSSTNTGDSAVARLDQLKGARKRWAGALISGQKSGSCLATNHSAIEAPKLHRLVDATLDVATGKSNVIWSTICNDTLDAAVTAAVSRFTEACDAL